MTRITHDPTKATTIMCDNFFFFFKLSIYRNIYNIKSNICYTLATYDQSRYVVSDATAICKFKYHLVFTIAIDRQTIAQHNRVETVRFF